MFDIADECEDYDSFKTEVERFFHEPDHVEEEKWNNAYQLLKDGKVEPEPPFFSALPKQSPEWCLRCLLLVMCTYPFAKKALTLHLARGEGRERYFGCNLMQRRVLASSH